MHPTPSSLHTDQSSPHLALNQPLKSESIPDGFSFAAHFVCDIGRFSVMVEHLCWMVDAHNNSTAGARGQHGEDTSEEARGTMQDSIGQILEDDQALTQFEHISPSEHIKEMAMAARIGGVIQGFFNAVAESMICFLCSMILH